MDVDMGSAAPSPPQSETISNAVKEKQEEVDRISEFPDDILGRILYFLPSKEAAATTILSSRWKHVFWSTATMLDIDISQSSTKDNTIQFFEALFNCRTLISACITTDYFHVPAAFCLPKLKHLFVKSTEDFDCLEKTHDRLQDMDEARFEYIFGGKFIVFQEKVKPTEEEDLFGVQTLPSLSIC